MEIHNFTVNVFEIHNMQYSHRIEEIDTNVSPKAQKIRNMDKDLANKLDIVDNLSE